MIEGQSTSPITAMYRFHFKTHPLSIVILLVWFRLFDSMMTVNRININLIGSIFVHGFEFITCSTQVSNFRSQLIETNN